MQNVRTLESSKEHTRDADDVNLVTIVARAAADSDASVNVSNNVEPQVVESPSTVPVEVSQCTMQLIGEARAAFNQNQLQQLKLEQSTILDATFSGQHIRSSTPMNPLNLDATVESEEPDTHDSSFVALYSKMMEQYHEQQGQISDDDVAKLNAEFATWQQRIVDKIDAAQETISTTNAKIEATRKIKSQLDKDKTRILKQIMDTKNAYRKLVKLSDQLEHMSAFLAENTNVMRNAKEKARQINNDERQHLERLTEQVSAASGQMRERMSVIEPLVVSLEQKCSALRNQLGRDQQEHELERTTQNEQIEAKVQSLAEASGASAAVEAELIGRTEHADMFTKQRDEARTRLNELNERLREVKERMESNEMSIANQRNNIETNQRLAAERQRLADETETKTALSLETMNAESVEQVNRRHQQRAHLRHECTELSRVILELEEENVERKKRLNRAEFDVELCKGEERHIRQTFDEKQAIMNEIEKELDELDDIIAGQNRQLEIEKSETNDEKGQLKQLEHGQAERNDEISRLNERDCEMEQKLAETQKALNEAKLEFNRISANQNDLASKLEQLEKERSIRNGKIDEITGLIDSKRHHTTFLLAELTRLQAERADFTEQSLNQSNMVHDTIQSAIDLKRELDRVQSEFNERQTQLDTLSGRHAEHTSLLERRDLANDEREKVRMRISEVEASLALTNVDAIHGACDQLNEELKELQSHETFLVSARNEIEAEIDAKNESMISFDLEEAIEEEKHVDGELRENTTTLASIEAELAQIDGLKERTIDNLNQVVQRRQETVDIKLTLIERIQHVTKRQAELTETYDKVESNVRRMLKSKHKTTKKRVPIYQDKQEAAGTTRLSKPKRAKRDIPTIYKPRDSSTPMTQKKAQKSNKRKRRGLRPIDNVI